MPSQVPRFLPREMSQVLLIRAFWGLPCVSFAFGAWHFVTCSHKKINALVAHKEFRDATTASAKKDGIDSIETVDGVAGLRERFRAAAESWVGSGSTSSGASKFKTSAGPGSAAGSPVGRHEALRPLVELPAPSAELAAALRATWPRAQPPPEPPAGPGSVGAAGPGAVESGPTGEGAAAKTGEPPKASADDLSNKVGNRRSTLEAAERTHSHRSRAVIARV